MKCNEDVLVTLRIMPGGKELDMELPAFLPAKELEQRLLEVLSEMDPLHWGGASAVGICKGQRRLEGDMTLAEAGVWDGSILEANLCGEVERR